MGKLLLILNQNMILMILKFILFKNVFFVCESEKVEIFFIPQLSPSPK